MAAVMEQGILVVEIDVDYCVLRYGETTADGTCPAVLGTDSVAKCFNSLKTCAVRESFQNEPVTLRFVRAADYLPHDIDAIESLMSVNMTPATISLGEDLGQRATVQCVFRDHTHGDAGPGFDKYWTERGYDPSKQGSFWGKFRARQPYLQGRPMRVKIGRVGQSLAEFETHHYVIESFDGPRPDGTYSITAQDVLKLVDGKKSQAPRLSNGSLQSNIGSGASSLALSPVGVGDAEYPASDFYVAIGGKEIVHVSSRSGDTLTIDGRAQFNTEAQAHDAQDRVQLCLEYSGEDVADILADLLENYAGVDSSFIPISTWQAETSANLGQLYTALIAEPAGVDELIVELIQQAALALWWSDTDQLIKLQVLKGITTDAATFNETNIKAGSLRFQDQPGKRVSEVWTYYAQINPLEGFDPDNFRSASLNIDSLASEEYGVDAIRKIYSRWIPQGGAAVADTLNRKLLSRYRDPPRRVNFALHGTRPAPVVAAGGYRIAAQPVQDAFGAAATMPIQITRIEPRMEAFVCEAEEMLFTEQAGSNIRAVVYDTNTNNVNLRATYNTLYSAPDAETVVVCYVLPGVTIGSASTAEPAFDVGEWPEGVVPRIVVQGRIQGAGGKGGNGNRRGFVDGGQPTAQVGFPGGVALLTSVPVYLDASSGEIFGGGGGGGGGQHDNNDGTLLGGSGGGGGAGTIPGPRGVGFETTPPNLANGNPGTADSGGSGGPSVFGQMTGGDGGDPGEAGEAGGGNQGRSGGAAGAAIDGDSNVTLGTWDAAANDGEGEFTPGATTTEDIRGPQIN